MEELKVIEKMKKNTKNINEYFDHSQIRLFRENSD
jgi:hypothetical protein